MAEVIGFLRDDANDIEKHILRLLGRHPPDELTDYVESPIYKKQYSRTTGQSRDGRRGLAGRVRPVYGRIPHVQAWQQRSFHCQQTNYAYDFIGLSGNFGSYNPK